MFKMKFRQCQSISLIATSHHYATLWKMVPTHICIITELAFQLRMSLKISLYLTSPIWCLIMWWATTPRIPIRHWHYWLGISETIVLKHSTYSFDIRSLLHHGKCILTKWLLSYPFPFQHNSVHGLLWLQVIQIHSNSNHLRFLYVNSDSPAKQGGKMHFYFTIQDVARLPVKTMDNLQ